jgi:hypothetical protein
MTSLKSKALSLVLLSSAAFSFTGAFAAEPNDFQADVRQVGLGQTLANDPPTVSANEEKTGEHALDMQKSVQQVLLGNHVVTDSSTVRTTPDAPPDSTDFQASVIAVAHSPE